MPSLGKKIASCLGLGAFAKDWETVAALMESLGDACVLCAPDGSVTYMNAAGRRFFGSSPLAQAVTERAVDEEGNRLALAKFEAAVRNKAETSVELALHPAEAGSDSCEWFRVSIRQIGVGTLWRVADITARRALDEVIRQEMHELGEFLDVLPIGLYQIDAGGVIHFINQRLCEWLGYTNPREVKGKRLSDILAGTHMPELDGLWHGELTFRTRFGTMFTAFVSHAVYDENGETMLRAAVVREVASQAEREQSANEARLGFSWLFEEAPVGIAFIDMENIVTEANGAFLQMMGRKREEAVGAPLEEYFDAEDWAELENKIAKVKMGFIPRAQSEVKLKTVREKVAGVFVTPMMAEGTDGQPDIAGVVAHFIDNTERRNLEMQFSQAQKMQAIGQLAGGIAHDFNNLLTAILGSTDLLLQTHPPASPDFNELMNVHYSAMRAASLVGQLLSYSRKQRLKPMYLDVTEIFAELKYILVRLLGTKVTVQVEHGRNLGFVRVDKTQFDQVMVNLAVNARDAMPDGGTFTIRTRAEKVTSAPHVGAEDIIPGEYVVIDVSDTGTGIPEDVLQRIFEPFFSTKSGGSDSGTGLGLAMVYGNIRQVGGYIRVQSTPGAGTTFSIYLPRHTPEEVRRLTEEAARENGRVKDARPLPACDAEVVRQFVRVKPNVPKTGDQLTFDFMAAKPELPPPLPPSEDLTGSETVLLVEDEDGVRAVTKRALKGKGYTVIDCTCAEEALERVAEGTAFDVLVTDMIMPGMDGVTLASEVRAKRPGTKVLLISGFSEEAARGEIQDMPDFHFLPKPFSLRELGEKIKFILGGKNG